MAQNAYLKVCKTGKLDSKKAPDMFEGNCQAKTHEKWIEIAEFSHKFALPVSAATRSSNLAPTSRCEHENPSFKKFNDNATDDLMRACWTGQCLDMELDLYRALGVEDGGTDLAKKTNKSLQIVMEKCFITEFSINPLDESGGTEEFNVIYNKIEYVFAVLDFKEGKLDATKKKAIDWSWIDNKVGSQNAPRWAK